MSHRMIGVFRADSSRFNLTAEQVEQGLGRLSFAGAQPHVERRDETHTALQWDTTQTEYDFQRVVLDDGIVLIEGDRPYVAKLVVAIRQLFDPDAADVWVGNPGQGLGRVLRADDETSDVFQDWQDLPLDQFS